MKERIDKLLVERGLADSRTKAQALVMAGVVLVDEKRVAKPSESFKSEVEIRIKGEGPESRYVGRGGLKLEAALSGPQLMAGLVLHRRRILNGRIYRLFAAVRG